MLKWSFREAEWRPCLRFSVLEFLALCPRARELLIKTKHEQFHNESTSDSALPLTRSRRCNGRGYGTHAQWIP
jgi:hypothetical protein